MNPMENGSNITGLRGPYETDRGKKYQKVLFPFQGSSPNLGEELNERLFLMKSSQNWNDILMDAINKLK